MITLYSGTPGSGKSLHLAREVKYHLAFCKRAVIANFPINMKAVSKGKKKTGEFVYLPNHELSVQFLFDYARQHHKVGKEGQTVLVIDEAGIMFNSRDYGQYDRKGWINFFMTHRHYGYNIILVSQSDRMIDRQIRAFIEYDIKHRKVNNFGLPGMFLSLFRIPLFVAITYWYGMRERISSEFFRFRKSDARLYDTMMLFGGEVHGQKIGSTAEAPAGNGDTGSAGGDPSRPDASAQHRTAELAQLAAELTAAELLSGL